MMHIVKVVNCMIRIRQTITFVRIALPLISVVAPIIKDLKNESD